MATAARHLCLCYGAIFPSALEEAVTSIINETASTCYHQALTSLHASAILSDMISDSISTLAAEAYNGYSRKLNTVEESKSSQEPAPQGMIGLTSQENDEMLEDELPFNSFVGDESLPIEAGPEKGDGSPKPESQAVGEQYAHKGEAIVEHPDINSVKKLNRPRSPLVHQKTSEEADEAHGLTVLESTETATAPQPAGDKRTEADPRKVGSAELRDYPIITKDALKVLEGDNKQISDGEGKISFDPHIGKSTTSEVDAALIVTTEEQVTSSKDEVTRQGPALHASTSEEAAQANGSAALEVVETTASKIIEGSQSLEIERVEGKPLKADGPQGQDDPSGFCEKTETLQGETKGIHGGGMKATSDVQKKDPTKLEGDEAVFPTGEQGNGVEEEVTNFTQKDTKTLGVSPISSVPDPRQTSKEDIPIKAVEAKLVVQASASSDQNSSCNYKEDALEVGGKVECRFQNTTKWYPGSVRARHPKANGGGFLYDIIYDDQDHEEGVRRLKIRLPLEKQRALLEVGEQVDARSPNGKGVEGAVVVGVNADGTYKLRYDSGPTLNEVERKYVFGRYSKAPEPLSLKGSTGAQENSNQPQSNSVDSTAPKMELQQATSEAEGSKDGGLVHTDIATKKDIEEAALTVNLSKHVEPSPTEAMDHRDTSGRGRHPPLVLPYPQFTGFFKVRSNWGMVHGQVFLNYKDKLTQFIVHAPSGPPEVDLENDERAINALRDLFIKKYR